MDNRNAVILTGFMRNYDGPRVRRFGFTYLKVCFKIEKIETEDKKVSAT